METDADKLSHNQASLELIRQFMDNNKGIVSAYFIINIVTLFLETIILSKISSELFTNIKSAKDSSFVAPIFIKFLVVYTIVQSGYCIRGAIYDIIIPAFTQFSKTEMYKDILHRYKIEYKELNLGHVQYNFHNLPSHLNRLIIEFLQEYIPNTLAILICSLYLGYVFPKIGVLVAVCAILVFVVLFFRFKVSYELSKKEHEVAVYSNEYVQDKLNNLFNIYTSNTEQDEIAEHKTVEDKLRTTTFENFSFNTKTSTMLVFMTIIITAIVYYIIYANFRKTISPTTAVLIILILGYYNGYLTKLANNLVSVVDIMGYVYQANVFLDEIQNHEVVNVSNLSNHSILTGDIKFDDIDFSYKKEDGSPVEVIKDANMEVKEYSKVAILGQSGSGKSTLIKLLLGFYEIDNGSITIGNKNIKDIDIDTLRKNVGLMGQTIKLFDESVADNVIYGTEYSVDQALQILKERGALILLKILENSTENTTVYENVENFWPTEEMLQKRAGVNGSNLSGGQKQIVNFLRVLLQSETKNIFVLDEPTSALDMFTKRKMLEIIKNYKKTTIIITHDLDVLQYVDSSYKIEDKKIIKIM